MDLCILIYTHLFMLPIWQERRPSWVLDRRSPSYREEHNLWPCCQRSAWWETHRGSVQNTRSASCRLHPDMLEMFLFLVTLHPTTIRNAWIWASTKLPLILSVKTSFCGTREQGSGMRCRTCRWLTFSPRWLHCQRPTSRLVSLLILWICFKACRAVASYSSYANGIKKNHQNRSSDDIHSRIMETLRTNDQHK